MKDKTVKNLLKKAVDLFDVKEGDVKMMYYKNQMNQEVMMMHDDIVKDLENEVVIHMVLKDDEEKKQKKKAYEDSLAEDWTKEQVRDWVDTNFQYWLKN